ncbi:DUF2510 domain-containing protein, partial [Streptomyces scabiei]|uniref:DUF2510 domain-containing protein n=1 Tax=Streptomyces scabiei TaxID=1930 RepID=UPI00298FFB43
MSAPTPAPGDDRPREGYYPDPSIPGYVRYWNGAAWVPGTSRPAPSDGRPIAPPPDSGSSGVVEETGPHFFDEDPAADGEQGRPVSDNALHGSRPEPASAWGADRSRQTGFGGDKDRRVSWGSASVPDPRDPRVPLAADAGGPADGGDPGRTASTDGTATIPPADADEEAGATPGTVVFRRPAPQGAENATPPRPGGGVPLTPAQAAAQQALGLAPQPAAPAVSGPQQQAQPPQQPPQQGPQSGPQSGTAPQAPAPVVPAAAPVAPAPPRAEPPRGGCGGPARGGAGRPGAAAGAPGAGGRGAGPAGGAARGACSGGCREGQAGASGAG